MILVAMVLAAAPPHSAPKRCHLSVDGRVLVSGRCLVYPLGNRGYTLNTSTATRRRPAHFAQVNANPDGTAEAFWNKDPRDDRALDTLGAVRLVNGCWVNERARICAR